MLTSTNMQSSTVIVCAVLCAAVFLSQDTCASTIDPLLNITSTTNVTVKPTGTSAHVASGVSSSPSDTHIPHSTPTNTSGNGTTGNSGNSGNSGNGGEGLHAPPFIAIILSVCAMLY